jgi:hypothetical protein
MKWLSGRCGNGVGSMTLGAIVLGAMSMFPVTGQATGRTDGAKREAVAVAQKSRAAAPRSVAAPIRPVAKPAGCNDAMDALALCKLPTATATATAKRSSVEDAASDRRTSDPSDARTAPMAIAAPAVAHVAVPGAAVEAPGHLLPVFALGMALAGVLLGWLGFRAIASKAGGDVPARANGFSLGMPKRSATAALAKERLLHYRTAPN